MPKSAKSLAGVKLFEGLDEAECAGLEACCAWRRYRLGERVFERGSEDQEVYFVIEGAVSIVNFSPSGREIAFATAEAGATFGELAAIDGRPRSASVVAREDSLLALMPPEPFLDLLRRHAEITFQLLQRLATIVRQGDERVLELSTLEATNRVYAEILRLAEPDEAAPDLWVIKPLPPLRDIASRASTTRDQVARALGQLYPGGLLNRKGGNLYVMDREALEEIVRATKSDSRR